MNRTRNHKGQSTLEYILLVTAVVVVALAYLGSTGGFQSTVKGTMSGSTDKMKSFVDSWKTPKVYP